MIHQQVHQAATPRLPHGVLGGWPEGRRGWPGGRTESEEIHESLFIFGPESSGKTTLTLSVIAEAQRQGKTCAFIDAEHALDPSYAEKLGVNLDDMLVSQPCQATRKTDPQATRKIDPSVSSPGGSIHAATRI